MRLQFEGWDEPPLLEKLHLSSQGNWYPKIIRA